MCCFSMLWTQVSCNMLCIVLYAHTSGDMIPASTSTEVEKFSHVSLVEICHVNDPHAGVLQERSLCISGEDGGKSPTVLNCWHLRM